MRRHRTLAGPPFRSSGEAWEVLVQLLENTLERSSDIVPGSVRDALQPLSGVGPALIAGGHVEDEEFVLRDESIDLAIKVVTGDQAFEIEENLNPVPGGASCSADWTLHLPTPAPLQNVLAVISSSSHNLSVEQPSTSKASRTQEEVIDLTAMQSHAEEW